MKALILSCNTGQGHNTAGRAVLEELKAKGMNIEDLNALALAEEAGSSRAVNIVLMGRAAKQFDIPYDRWIAAIENTVAPKFVEMNKKAFDLGYHS